MLIERRSFWPLHHRVLRHGRSQANDQHLIVSTIVRISHCQAREKSSHEDSQDLYLELQVNGVPPRYGLSDLGRQQAQQAR